MTTPRISVLMPTYNASAFIEAAVESILRQTYGDFEFLAIDDGSTDATRTLLQRCAASDRRVTVLTCSHGGCVRALNVGLRHARGEFVARMDADDIAAPDRFTRQLAFLKQNPQVVAVGTAVEYIDSENESLGQAAVQCVPSDLEKLLLAGKTHGLWHPTVMMRREALVRLGGYREQYTHAEDRDLWLRMLEVGQLANLPEPLLRYRLHEGNTCQVSRQKLAHTLIRQALREAHARRGSQPPRLPVRGFSQWIPGLANRHRWVRLALRQKNWRAALKHAGHLARTRWWSPHTWWMFACCVPHTSPLLRTAWKTIS